MTGMRATPLAEQSAQAGRSGSPASFTRVAAASTVSMPSPTTRLRSAGHSLTARGVGQRPSIRRSIFCASAVKAMR